MSSEVRVARSINSYYRFELQRTGAPKLVIYNNESLPLGKITGKGIIYINISDWLNEYRDNISQQDKIGDIWFALHGIITLHRIQIIFMDAKLFNEFTRALAVKYNMSMMFLNDNSDRVIELVSKRTVTYTNYPCTISVVKETPALAAQVLRRALFKALDGEHIHLFGSEAESIWMGGSTVHHYGSNMRPYTIEMNNDEDVQKESQIINDYSSIVWSAFAPVLGHCSNVLIISDVELRSLNTHPMLPKIDIIGKRQIQLELNGNVSYIKDIKGVYDGLIIYLAPLIDVTSAGAIYCDLRNIQIAKLFYKIYNTNPIRAYMIAWNPGYMPILIPGECVLPPYGIGELVLLYSSDINNYIGIWDRSIHRKQLNSWCSRLENDYTLSYVQSKRIATIYVEDLDFMQVVIPRGETFLAMFSVSNTRNGYNAVKRLLLKYNGIAVVPWNKAHPRGDTQVRLEDETEEEFYLSNRSTLDYMYDYGDFIDIAYVYKPMDVVAYMSSKTYLGRYDPRDTLWYNWIILSNIPLFEDQSVDHIYNNQSYLVRLITPYIRLLEGHGQDTLHEYRARIADIEPVFNQESTGIYKGREINTAGHLLNELLASSIDVVCFRRIISVIVGNAKRSDLYKEWRGLLAEREYRYDMRWHTKLEYKLAILIAQILAERWGLKIHKSIIQYVSRAVESLPT